MRVLCASKFAREGSSELERKNNPDSKRTKCAGFSGFSQNILTETKSGLTCTLNSRRRPQIKKSCADHFPDPLGASVLTSGAPV